jgi:Na+/H+ antiporter NhaC
VVLNGLSFSIKGSSLPDSINSFTLIVENSEFIRNYTISVHKGFFDTLLTISQTGKFSVHIPELPNIKKSINVLPGFLSILPPLIAIVLALVLRQVIISLIVGIYAGSIFIYDYNPLIGFFRLIDKYIINAISDTSHIQIIVFTLLFGGVVGLISKCGGTRGIANLLTKFAKTRRSGMIVTWLSGLIIFFDDYANALVVGNLMRPITDKLKISREKLSFIVDATSAPVASIVIVSSWIGYEVGLIQDALVMIGSEANAYSIFIETIPYRFYPIAMLLFVLLIALSKKDFGSMYRAEKRAMNEGKVTTGSEEGTLEFSDPENLLANEDKAKWYNGLIPIFVIIFGTIAGLVYTGISSLQNKGISNYNLAEIISNSDSYLSLLWSSFAACVVGAVLIISQRILTLRKTIDAWFSGVRSMLLAVLILTLAWGIGAVTNEIKTADYIVSLISESIDPRLLPVIVFIVCGATSFATGTSWGTMAIMMPIVIPLSASVTGINNYTPDESHLILIGVISSVLAGAVWGDHCSPISDTTILSSIASGCNHIDHVRTQLTYAVLVGAVCMIFGDILSSYGLSAYISIIFIVLTLIGVVFIFGKKVTEEKDYSAK